MVRHRGKFVSYLRVSTKRQGESGLGLEGQRAAVEAFLNGGSWRLVEEFVEVESGKADHNRPALHNALEACKVYGATLVIAKIDRLSRDAHFLLGLQKAGVKFVAADMPEANEMVVGHHGPGRPGRTAHDQRAHQGGAAGRQGARPAARTTEGPPDPVQQATRAHGAATNAAAAAGFAERLRPVFAELAGLSANAAATELDRRGIATSRGGKWTARAVLNVRARLGD